MIWLTLAAALADEPCVDLADHLRAAWAAFDEAELAETDRLLAIASAQLTCQARVLSQDELQQLFLLDTTASMATGDEKNAVYAAIRAVTIAPDIAVDPRYGPAVAELTQTWARRLSSTALEVENRGATPLHIDGRALAPGAVFLGVEGEHVLQWEVDGVVHTEVRELVGRTGVDTGARDLIAPAAPSEPSEPIEPLTPAPATSSTSPPNSTAPQTAPPTASPARRRSAPAVWGTGIALAALGGGAVIAGWQVQERFEANGYTADVYGDCPASDPCWEEARADAIRRDATLIRALYGGGYGLMGAGAVLFGVGFAIHPGGGAVAVSLPF
jgi:hypothetical protein